MLKLVIYFNYSIKNIDVIKDKASINYLSFHFLTKEIKTWIFEKINIFFSVQILNNLWTKNRITGGVVYDTLFELKMTHPIRVCLVLHKKHSITLFLRMGVGRTDCLFKFGEKIWGNE